MKLNDIRIADISSRKGEILSGRDMRRKGRSGELCELMRIYARNFVSNGGIWGMIQWNNLDSCESLSKILPRCSTITFQQ